jgi:hypothetical protein
MKCKNNVRRSVVSELERYGLEALRMTQTTINGIVELRQKTRSGQKGKIRAGQVASHQLMLDYFVVGAPQS